MSYVDSVGNRYASVPPAKNPPGAGKSRNGAKKIGRNKKKPSAQRYLRDRRWEKNKARRAARRARGLPRPETPRASESR